MHRMDIRSEGPRSDSDGEWSLYWTDRHTQVPSGFLPLLDEWANIDSREQVLGIERDTPILIDPECRIDGSFDSYAGPGSPSWPRRPSAPTRRTTDCSSVSCIAV